MLVEIVKRADGAGVLRCVRDDGSVTWQKQKDRHAAFFSLHDLTHFAVETVLKGRGFFGLIAEGWDIEDTTGKGARGPLPPEAGLVESVVGLFDGERAAGVPWTLEQFHEFGGPGASNLTLEQIEAIRHCRSELFQKWFAVPAGETLRLQFPL